MLVPWIDVLTLYSVEPNIDSLVCDTIEVNNSRCRSRVVISPCCIIRFLHYWLSTPASLLLYLSLRLLDVVNAGPLRALIVTDVAAQRTPTLWVDLQSIIQHWWTIHHWLATSASLLFCISSSGSWMSVHSELSLLLMLLLNAHQPCRWICSYIQHWYHSWFFISRFNTFFTWCLVWIVNISKDLLWFKNFLWISSLSTINILFLDFELKL